MKFLHIYLSLLVLLISSCGRRLYNLDFVQESTIKDKQEQKLFVRIVNVGKTGISSIGIYTDSGLFRFRGILPGDTIPYVPIYSFYNNPGYRMTIVSDRFIGKLRAISIDGQAIDHIGDVKFTSGYYTIRVSATLIKRRIGNRKLEVVKD